MTSSQWLVLIGGIVAIVWVNWYFFFAEDSVKEPERNEHP
jgi:hypothetical protein